MSDKPAAETRADSKNYCLGCDENKRLDGYTPFPLQWRDELQQWWHWPANGNMSAFKCAVQPPDPAAPPAAGEREPFTFDTFDRPIDAKVAELRAQLAAKAAELESHLKHVGAFLSEMYATMIDPCAEGEIKVVEMTKLLLEAARANREALHERDDQNAKLTAELEKVTRERDSWMAQLKDENTMRCEWQQRAETAEAANAKLTAELEAARKVHTFDDFQSENWTRAMNAEKFAACRDWTLNDWALALVGEAGELCNLLKKIRRGDFTEQQMRGEILKEIADVITYADLMMSKLSANTAAEVIGKWQEVSDRIGYAAATPAPQTEVGQGTPSAVATAPDRSDLKAENVRLREALETIQKIIPMVLEFDGITHTPRSWIDLIGERARAALQKGS